MILLPAQDVEGLRQATLEIFVQTMEDESLERRLGCIPPDDLAQIEKLLPEKTLSPSYYEQVLYLLWLEDKMSAGIEFSAISADEAEGLGAIQRARQQFNREHPPCANCGKRVGFRGQKRCAGCGKELR